VDLRWAMRRLAAMDRREVIHRMRQTLHARLESLGAGRAQVPEPRPVTSISWSDGLPTGLDAGPYLSAAERILAGRFDVFALQDRDLGFPPRWNRDPKTGTEAPRTFGKRLNYRDERLVGDIKYLWEPNRHLELVALAQAWHLSGDERFAQGCRTLLESWFEQCPYLLGPNWTSSLEHGVRLMNWSFAWRLLGGEHSPLFQTGEGAAFRRRWLESIYQHAHFIRGHFSRFSSANNHLLGELAGLYLAGCTWPFWADLVNWKADARAEFEHEALLQNYADGVNREQATWYHHEVADMMLIAGLFNRNDHVPFKPEYWERLEHMLEFIAALMNAAGEVPMIGDADDAVMVHLVPNPRSSVYRSLLATGAVLFDRPEFRRKAGTLDDKTLWLLGDKARNCFASLPEPTPARKGRTEFPQGGYYILGEAAGTPDEVHLVADVGPLGYLAIAAHGHADALSCVLSVGGEAILVDPGTFAYHTQKKWRDYFRGTSAHNTVRVDGLDQSVAGGNFLWTRHANARVVERVSDATLSRLRGEHDGYSRLSDPVAVSREWVYHKSARRLEITDQLVCKGPHGVEIFWHVDPACEIRLGTAEAVIRSATHRLILRWPADLMARLVRGQEDPPLGWISRRFDSREPCQTLVVDGQIGAGWFGVTHILIDQDPHAA